MSRLWTLLSALLLLAAATDTFANDGDQFSFGGDKTVNTPVQGDSMLLGGNVNVEAPISGDLMATAGNVQIHGSVGKDLFAAGGEVALGAPVGGDAALFGGTVEITPAGKVQGDATLSGKTLRVRGPVAGRLKIGGSDILIDSSIGGEVTASAPHIELGPNARIMGSLRYSGSSELVRDPASEVHGTIEHSASAGRWHNWVFSRTGKDGDEDWEGGSYTWPARAWLHSSRPHFAAGGMAIVIALLIGLVAPGFARQLGATVDTQWGGAMLTGLGVLIGAPILMLILVVTVIGIPIAILLGLAYALVLVVGYAASGVAFGELALHRLAPERSNDTAMRLLAAAVAMVLVIAAARMPMIGWLVPILATLTGTGALVMLMRRRGPPPAAAY